MRLKNLKPLFMKKIILSFLTCYGALTAQTMDIGSSKLEFSPNLFKEFQNTDYFHQNLLNYNFWNELIKTGVKTLEVKNNQKSIFIDQKITRKMILLEGYVGEYYFYEDSISSISIWLIISSFACLLELLFIFFMVFYCKEDNYSFKFK